MHICCFSTSSNLSNFIGIQYAQGHSVTYIYPKIKKSGYDSTLLDRLTFKAYLMKNNIKDVNQVELNFEDLASIKSTLEKLPNDAVILMPAITRGPHIHIYQAVQSQSRRCLFVEPDGDLYEINSDGVIPLNDDDVSLSVKHFIQQTNGYIMQTNTQLFKETAANDLLNHILKYLEIFQNLFKNVRPLKKVETVAQHPDAYDVSPLAIVDLTKMKPFEKSVYIEALSILKKHRILSMKQNNTTIDVEFHDIRYKEYFSKSGTWLEHFTQRALESVEGISDINSSVHFVWDRNLSHLQNEIDVMALIDNQLITVSCKDTTKILENYLYILESHSEQLSDDAIKFVVCTTAPNALIQDRADRLNVHILVFDKDVKRFTKQVSQIIQRYRV